MSKAQYLFNVIARIHSDFPTKFGIPRQSGLIPSLISTIVFEPEYRNPDALRGLDAFSHLWLIWCFSENLRDTWSPTVRPPRLGGNTRMGVFATRSSFRPNPIALSSVKFEGIQITPNFGHVILVSGADLMDNSPILDIKPYLSFTDAHTDAQNGFAEDVRHNRLCVSFATPIPPNLPSYTLDALTEILAQDPRPSYQNDPDRIYGFSFAGFEIKYTVQNQIATVIELIPHHAS